MFDQLPLATIVIVVFALYVLANSIRILREYERGVIFRLGRLVTGGVKRPGAYFTHSHY
jgi:regulator of protease activity HflC (stomatin/prohibitin superfamily)